MMRKYYRSIINFLSEKEEQHQGESKTVISHSKNPIGEVKFSDNEVTYKLPIYVLFDSADSVQLVKFIDDTIVIGVPDHELFILLDYKWNTFIGMVAHEVGHFLSDHFVNENISFVSTGKNQEFLFTNANNAVDDKEFNLKFNRYIRNTVTS